MIVDIIGVPITYGCGKIGAQLAPKKLREANLETIISNYFPTKDLGDISVRQVAHNEIYKDHPKMKFLNPIVECCNSLSNSVFNSLKNNHFPIIVGGDHSLAMGSIAGASKFFNEDLIVIWVDAHGDINTDLTSSTGNIHGMPLGASMGFGHESLVNISYPGQKINPDNVYIIGARDLDFGEILLAKNLNLKMYTMDIIDQRGFNTILDEMIENIMNSNISNIHLSFDIDSLDKSLVPGTGTPVKNGFDIIQAKTIIEKIIATGKLKSIDFVELNPLLDDHNNSTSKISLDLIEFIFKTLKINKS